MTPGQAALLPHAIGIAIVAVPITRRIRAIEEADPLDLCDSCRTFRRGWMTLAPAIRERAPWMIPLVVLVAAAMWPVIAPRNAWWVIRHRRLRHVCDRMKPEPADGQEQRGDHG